MGNCSYDQAVTEFGPRDKAAKLSDGTTVEECRCAPNKPLSRQARILPHRVIIMVLHARIFRTRFPPVYLRLTFAPDGWLKQFKEFAR